MKKYALIFPGQGAQKPGMGKDLYETSEAAKNVFDTADRVLGRSISDLCFNGSEDDLKLTINSQPCILTVSLAALEALKEKSDLNIACAAGHSLGEYAALYATGAADLETVLKLIEKRAFLMNEAAQNTNGAMAAVLGLDDNAVIEITKDLNNVFVANYNCPGQVVITGGQNEINESINKYKEAGAKKVIPLAVSGAFHSPLMKEASIKFSNYIKEFKFNNVNTPVYINVTGNTAYKSEEFMQELPEQIYSSVEWTKTINNIVNTGITDFIEIGPGKVLAGLNKKINPQINTMNIYDAESLNITTSEIENKMDKELV